MASDLDDLADAGASKPVKKHHPPRAWSIAKASKPRKPGGLRGYDAGKKINGRKRHLVTDTVGLPLNLVVHAANIQDRDGLALPCRWIKRQFP